ncbi:MULTISPECIES: thioredoxin fold domain-containing protein [Sphingobacterium]|uniref:Thioredoxin n=1 Tax=Sphingobacterium multivorum TaxID=28454 RepID=A0A2X2JEX8_SPHMU|nr:MULTISPECIES: thioredoxin fold domain-containing protein [Sphingobacterium]QRQ63677.1 thioredoxin family protein [Sphingobacterium multivorum]SPZ85745.1 Thioredoxin [Sphingobacterium multivorum]
MQKLKLNEAINHFTEAETDQAFQLAKRKQLPVLVDFWAPACKGCKKMELVTYQNPEIRKYVDNHFVFVKYDITNRNVPKIQSTPILWTPTFIVFANDGSELRKIIGYLDNCQFEAEMEIGRAMAFLRKAQPQAALALLENFIANSTNETFLPEFLYWAGVASFFINKRNPESLIFHWQRLLSDYPESVWAQRSDILNVIL